MVVSCTSQRLCDTICDHPNFNYDRLSDTRKWDYKGMDTLGLLHTFAIGGEERIISSVNTFTGDILIVGYAPNESKANNGSKLN
jgi:hypothetical protein